MKRAIIGCGGFGCVMAALSAGSYLAVILVVSVVVYLMIRAKGTRASGYMTVRGHVHDGPISRVSLHEGGHLDAIERVGGRITGAQVSGDDRRASGYAEGIIPNDPAARIGVALAGLAAAPDTESPTDEKTVDHVLRSVPAPYRGTILREGQRIAAKAGASSNARRYAKILERRGRL